MDKIFKNGKNYGSDWGVYCPLKVGFDFGFDESLKAEKNIVCAKSEIKFIYRRLLSEVEFSDQRVFE